MSQRYNNNPPHVNPRIRGRCPSCGAESLFLGHDGYVTCSVIGCKNPGAAHDLLAAQIKTDTFPAEIEAYISASGFRQPSQPEMEARLRVLKEIKALIAIFRERDAQDMLRVGDLSLDTSPSVEIP